MKATGFVRPLDHLGRLVLPVSLRRERGIVHNDDLEISVDGEHIILQKHRPGCVFCGQREDLAEFKGKTVCQACRAMCCPLLKGSLRHPNRTSSTLDPLGIICGRQSTSGCSLGFTFVSLRANHLARVSMKKLRLC